MRELINQYVWINFKQINQDIKCYIVNINEYGVLVNTDKDYTHTSLDLVKGFSYELQKQVEYQEYNKGLTRERFYPFHKIEEIVILKTDMYENPEELTKDIK